MGKLKINILLALLFFCEGHFSLLSAQTLIAKASATTVEVGQQFEVEFSLDASCSQLTPPAFTGFSAYGPSQSTSISYINGKMSESMSTSYTLVATAEGTYTIGPATVKCGSKTFTSNPLTIKVEKGATGNTSSQTNNNPSQPGNSSAQAPVSGGNKNLFIRLIPSKSKVYVGEELSATLKIYFRVNIEPQWQQTNPDYSGFYTLDIPNTKNQLTPTRENMDGVAYSTVEIPQKILFPQHSGKIKIEPLGGEFVVEQAVKSNNIFQQFFGGSQRVPYTIKSEPVTIDVTPLPKTEKDFSGAVGELSLKGSLDKNNVKANEAVNLTITVSGSGNLKLIDTLPIKFPPDFDHYDPKISDHFTINTSGVSGSRTFSYLIIPRHPGSFKISPVEFTYFNPKKKEYVTLTTPDMDLQVTKGDNNTSTVTVSGPVNKEDVKTIGSDIRYIHSGHEAYYHSDDFFLYSFPFFAGIISPLLIFAGFVIGRRRYVEMHKDTLAVRQRGATRMAKKRLKIAHQNIASGNKEVFYAELLNALNGYFSDKFSIPLADLSRDTVSANLAQKNVKPETMVMVNKTLDDCEFARYAPAAVTGNLLEVYTSAVNLITQLEDEIA
jgi:hypothetical protein